jgi:type IV secretory pathway VirB2 component (pilin)
MPETTRRRTERAEFAAAIAIAAVVMTGAYLIANQLPFLLGVVIVGGVAFGLTALVSAGISRKEARR